MVRSFLKMLSLLYVFLLPVISVVGCGSQTANGQASSSKSVGGSAVTQDIKGTLHFYTSQPDEDANALIGAFKKKYPNVTVQMFRSGTEEVVSRLLAEDQAKNVQADVLLLADAPTFVTLKNKNLLLPYKSSQADQIPTELRDPDGAFYGTKVMATVLAVNTQKVSNMPDSWKVLTSPDTRGQSIMPSPLYSGAAAYNVGVFTRQADFGWDYFKQLKTDQMTVAKGNGAVLKSVASGEKNYGMIVDFMVTRAIKDGSPLKLVYPKEGVPVITEPIGILKNSKNTEAAKAFVDFVLSEEGQKVFVDLGYMPIRKGVQPPAGLPTIDKLKIMSVSQEELEHTREQDKKQFGEIMGGK